MLPQLRGRARQHRPPPKPAAPATAILERACERRPCVSSHE
jgi:hypothetical protein